MHKIVNGQRIDLTPTEIAEWEADQAAQVALENIRPQKSLSRGDFAIASATQGWVTEQEAEEWASGVSIPPWVITAINSNYPEADRLRVRIAIRTGEKVYRLDPVVTLLQSELSVTDAVLDEVFNVV